MTRIAADEYARAYTIFDILNEPDAVSGTALGGTLRQYPKSYVSQRS